MAPWPEQNNEPKAPDRTKGSESRTADHLKSKSEPPEDKRSASASAKDENQGETKKKDVHSLDDGQLKALLDEAIQYKCPKDREGKSKIFRELLQKVEADESDCSYPVVGLRGSGGRRAVRAREGSKAVAVSERATRGGSLQNIFVAAGNSEFDTHHAGGARRKNKQRQGPGSSVSARQREGGSLPCNVNAGWPVESWSDQLRRKGLFDKEQGCQAAAAQSVGNAAHCPQASVASPAGATSTQARRQTLMHSASNELPAAGKHNPGELYPLRRHHSSSDQSKASLEPGAKVKHKSHSESSSSCSGSSAGRKMPQVTAKPEYTSLDMGGLDLEMKTFSRVHCAANNNSLHADRYRLTSSDVEADAEQGTTGSPGEVYTTRARLEVEPVDSAIELDLHHHDTKPLVNMKLNDVDCVELNDNYTSVQSLVGDHCDQANQGGGAVRHHAVYRTMNLVTPISVVNIDSKQESRKALAGTDENGNPSQAIGPLVRASTAAASSISSISSMSSMSTSAATKKNHHKRKQSEKNVVLSVSQNIAGYRGDKDLDTLLNFIESDKTKVGGKPSLKKAGGVLVGSLSNSNSNAGKSSKKQHKRQAMTKSSSMEEISQRNLSDLTESAESERSVVVRKPRSQEDTVRERRSWGDQVYIRSESQNDISGTDKSVAAATTDHPAELQVDDTGENNSDSEFQMVTKKQRKRKTNESGGKRGRSHRGTRRSPRRKSTSSVPPSERSGESDLDSVHSLPVGGGGGGGGSGGSGGGTRPAVISYAHIAAGHGTERDKTNDIEEWCQAVTEHLTNSHADDSDPDKCDSNDRKAAAERETGGNKVVEVPVVSVVPAASVVPVLPAVPPTPVAATAARQDKVEAAVDRRKGPASPATPPVATPTPPAKNWTVNQVDRKRNLNREEFPSLPTKNGGWRRPEAKGGDKGGEGKEGRSKSAGRTAPPAQPAANHAAYRPAVILLQDDVPGAARDSSVCEITFGFEVNQQLLTNDEVAQVVDDMEAEEAVDETSSSSSSEVNFHKALRQRDDRPAKEQQGSDRGDRGEAEPLAAALAGPSPGAELLKRHDRARCGVDIADIAYVPPKTPIQFNHDKIVTFVELAWEDVMRQGKIQYYTGDN